MRAILVPISADNLAATTTFRGGARPWAFFPSQDDHGLEADDHAYDRVSAVLNRSDAARAWQDSRHLDDTPRAIPSITVLFTMGITALARQNYGMLATILAKGVLWQRGEGTHN